MEYFMGFLIGIMFSTPIYHMYIVSKINNILEMLQDLDTCIIKISYLDAEMAERTEQIRDDITYNLSLMQNLL